MQIGRNEQREVHPGEVAQREDVSTATVIRWCREQRIACRRTVGGRWRVRVDADGVPLSGKALRRGRGGQ